MKKNRIVLISLMFAGLVSAAESRLMEAPSMQPPVLDGVIHTAEWLAASVDSGMTQLEPFKGKPVSEKTHIYMGMDENHLYVAFACFVTDSNLLTAGNARRDKQTLIEDDGVMLLLDTFGDRRSAYLFHVNLLNTQSDARIESNGGTFDITWDGEWQSATSRNERGWYAEFSIPFKTMKFNARQKVWGINFGRVIARRHEVAYWSGTLDDVWRVSQAGALTLRGEPARRKPVQWIPYLSQQYRDLAIEQQETGWNTEIGMDAEIPISPDLSANLTVNPDFASVEGDQEKLNLDLWEIRYPEKRPFFRDVNALFQSRIQVFYSRRIGDIIHGEKVAGKVGSYQIAGLYSRTSSHQTKSGPMGEAGFSAFRLQKDILAASTLGMTWVEKRQGQVWHRVLSVDTKMRLPRQFYVTGQFAASWPGSFWDHAGGFVRVARENNLYHYHIRYTAYGKHFRDNTNAAGLVDYDNVQEVDSDAAYNFWFETTPFKRIDVASKNRFDWDLKGDLWRSKLTQQTVFYLRNRLSINLQQKRDARDLDEGEKVFQSWEIELGYNTMEWSFVELGYEFGDSFTRPFDLLFFRSRFKPLPMLSLDYQLEQLHYNPDPEKESTDIHVLGADLYFNNDLFIRLFAQYRTNIHRTYVYGLFGWRFKPPNSAFYLTYTVDERDTDLPLAIQRQNRVFFLKLSHGFAW